MAVAAGGFSIREYTANARSEDFGRCWPFGGEAGSLPPITVQKFRWWRHELGAARHAGADEARPRPKAKQRSPKKRSIAELFAVARHVETLSDGVDGSDIGVVRLDGSDDDNLETREPDLAGAGDDNYGVERPMTPKNRKAKMKLSMKKEMISKKICLRYKNKSDYKRRKKMPFIEICAAKKEKIHKPKMLCVIDHSHILQGPLHKLFGKTLSTVDGQKRKPSALKSLSKEHDFRTIQPARLINKDQKEIPKAFPVHSILKTRATITKRKTGKHDAKGKNQIRPDCESEKNLTFSGKDDVIGHSKNCTSTELPQLQSLCNVFSAVLPAASSMEGSGNGGKLPSAIETAQVVMEGVKDDTICIRGSIERSEPEKKQPKDDVYRDTFPTDRNNETEKRSIHKIVDLNLSTESYDNLNCLSAGTSASSPRHSSSRSSQILNSTCREGPRSDSQLNTQESIVTSNSRSLPMPVGSNVSLFDATSTVTINRELDAIRRSPDFQPVHNISTKDLMSSICSSVGSKKNMELRPIPDPFFVVRDEHNAEGFIGLPLNLQGELIKSQSSRKCDIGDPSMKQNPQLRSGHTSLFPNLTGPMKRMNHEKLIEKSSGAQNDQQKWVPDCASKSVESCLSIHKLQDTERIEVQNIELARTKDSLIHKDGYKECTQTSNWIDRGRLLADRKLDHRIQPAIQTTMRLMGRDVIVGKSCEELPGFDDKKIWIDKETIPKEPSHMPGMYQWQKKEQVAYPAIGKSLQNNFHSLDALSSLYNNPVVEPLCRTSHFDCQGQWVASDNPFSKFGNHRSEVNNSPSHMLPPRARLSETSTACINHGSIISSAGIGHHIPAINSADQQLLFSSTHCKHSNNFSYNPSNFCPKFTIRDNDTSVELPSSHSLSCVPKWLSNSLLEKNNPSTCPLYPDPTTVRNPCFLPRANFHPLPPYSTSIFPPPLYDNHVSNTHGSSSQTSSVHSGHPSFAPSYPANKYIPAVNPLHKDKKNRDGGDTNSTYFKLLDRVNMTQKRPADNNYEFMRQLKKPNITVKGYTNDTCGLRRSSQLLGCTPCSTVYPNAPDYQNKVVGTDNELLNNEKESFRMASGSGCLEFDCVSKSGPVKLSAGAKHILKPSQNKEHDNSKQTCSTMPFTHPSSSSKLPISQKKVAKIYQF